MVVLQVRPRCTQREEAAAAAEEGVEPREVSETGPRRGPAQPGRCSRHLPRTGPRAIRDLGSRSAPGSVSCNFSFVGGGCWGFLWARFPPLGARRPRSRPLAAPPRGVREWGAWIDGGGAQRGGGGRSWLWDPGSCHPLDTSRCPRTRGQHGWQLRRSGSVGLRAMECRTLHSGDAVTKKREPNCSPPPRCTFNLV
jgi:hypothetical protein